MKWAKYHCHHQSSPLRDVRLTTAAAAPRRTVTVSAARARATTVASLALCSLDDLGRDRDARRREGMLETSHCRIFLNKVAFGITTAEESCACWQHCRSVDGVLENAR